MTTHSTEILTHSPVARVFPWRPVTLIAAPALLALAGVLSPINDSDEPDERLADLLDNAGRYSVAVVCLAAALMLLVPAVFALRDLVPAANRRLATVGATIAAAGFMMFVTISGAVGFGPSAWADLPDAETSGLVPIFTVMDEGKGALAAVFPGPLLPIIGLALLATALWRHTGAAHAALVAMPLGWAIFLFTPVAATKVVGALVLLAAFAVLDFSARDDSPA
jgi:hypothetical protein